MGIITADRHPSSVPAHCTPRFANICFEKSGNPAATLDRRMMFAATVEAALHRVSITSTVAMFQATPTREEMNQLNS